MLGWASCKCKMKHCYVPYVRRISKSKSHLLFYPYNPNNASVF